VPFVQTTIGTQKSRMGGCLYFSWGQNRQKWHDRWIRHRTSEKTLFWSVWYIFHDHGKSIFGPPRRQMCSKWSFWD